MANIDRRIDAYIANAQPFARPILEHLRSLVHHACPGVEETMKWSFPHFDYCGEMMCSMAAFKHHCAFGFWKAPLLKERSLLRNAAAETAMGHLGKITSLKDLPSGPKLISLIKKAAALNEQGVKIRKSPAKKHPPLRVPAYFLNAIRTNAKAFAVFTAFTPSKKKEYVEWVTEAKTDKTRERRIATAVQWIAEGKVRNWKYIKK